MNKSNYTLLELRDTRRRILIRRSEIVHNCYRSRYVLDAS